MPELRKHDSLHPRNEAERCGDLGRDDRVRSPWATSVGIASDARLALHQSPAFRALRPSASVVRVWTSGSAKYRSPTDGSLESCSPRSSFFTEALGNMTPKYPRRQLLGGGDIGVHGGSAQHQRVRFGSVTEGVGEGNQPTH